MIDPAKVSEIELLIEDAERFVEHNPEAPINHYDFLRILYFLKYAFFDQKKDS